MKNDSYRQMRERQQTALRKWAFEDQNEYLDLSALQKNKSNQRPAPPMGMHFLWSETVALAAA